MRVALLGNRDSAEELGSLGKIVHNTLSEKWVDVVPLNNIFDITGEKIDAIVHSRRVNKSIQKAVNFAQENGTSLINLSTGLKPQIPDSPNFRFIEAPNAAIDVVQFLIDINKDAERFKGWIATVVEHHQVKKDSLPGTAVEMAKTFGIDRNNKIMIKECWNAYKAENPIRTHGGIISVRDWEASKEEFDIPDEYQGGYGIHRITLHNPESGVTIERGGTQVLGRRPYAEGTYQFLKALEIAPDKIPLGVTHVVDFVRNGYHQLVR